MKLKNILAKLRDIFLTRYDPIELFRLRQMKKNGELVDISSLVAVFKDSTSFAFATGGSLSNLQGLGRANNHNLLMLTTGPIHSFRLFGLLPNIWLIHNPDSVRMTIRALDKYGLRGKIDFSETYILIPSNKSNSKVRFSSKRVRKLRSVIGNAKYVQYTEQIYADNESPEDYLGGNSLPEKYLETGVSPIRLINGSSVEVVILPFLAYLGIKEIYFSGVDHMDTGHFWDRNDPWQNVDGSPKTFSDSNVVKAAGEVALQVTGERGINVFRLEKRETNLTHYPYLDFEQALSRATKRVLPNGIDS